MSTFPRPVLRTWETSLTDHSASVRAARRHIRDQLTAWGWTGDRVDDLVLIASELVTNAVVHACQGQGEVRLYLQEFDGDCRFEVWDPRHDLPLQERRPRRSNEGGRGIDLVAGPRRPSPSVRPPPSPRRPRAVPAPFPRRPCAASNPLIRPV
ncbi:ATP-binding protein [Kitasatospora sp. NPDC008115]|uniref:ATP-binding protein n=1 Tax=Kitasatospora sp. NPDC008115 TaxID=3364022 RepID=UPI0036E50A58